jgi:hypothetical protein
MPENSAVEIESRVAEPTEESSSAAALRSSNGGAQPTPGPTSKIDAENFVLFVAVVLLVIALANPKTRGKAAKTLLCYFGLASVAGLLLSAFFAIGCAYSIGFSATWKLYRTTALLSPLIGPFFLLFAIVLAVLLEFSAKRLGRQIWVSIVVGFVLLAVSAAGYVGSRNEYPYLATQSANAAALSRSADDQNQVLGQVSQSGTALLNQLSSTEQQLAEAKKQLGATLSTFEQQRQSVSNVAVQLKRLDERQQAIALRTQELERILDGHRPITLADLEYSSRTSLFWGFFLGLIASLVASFLFTVVRGKRITSRD